MFAAKGMLSAQMRESPWHVERVVLLPCPALARRAVSQTAAEASSATKATAHRSDKPATKNTRDGANASALHFFSAPMASGSKWLAPPASPAAPKTAAWGVGKWP